MYTDLADLKTAYITTFIYHLVEWLMGETAAYAMLKDHYKGRPTGLRLTDSSFFLTYQGVEMQDVDQLIQAVGEFGTVDLTSVRLYDNGVPRFAVLRSSPHGEHEPMVVDFVTRVDLLEYEVEFHELQDHFGTDQTVHQYVH